jgi:hypothetical protein
VSRAVCWQVLLLLDELVWPALADLFPGSRADVMYSAAVAPECNSSCLVCCVACWSTCGQGIGMLWGI